MTGKSWVPETLETTFNRVLQQAPSISRNDTKLQKSILLFLKLGGERLARARIQPVVSPFPDDVSVIKPRPRLVPDDSADADDEIDNPESAEVDDPPEEQNEPSNA